MHSADVCVFRDPYMGKRPQYSSIAINNAGNVNLVCHQSLLIVTNLYYACVYEGIPLVLCSS